ncbi:GPI transamidase component PIG-S-like [Oppia nitens]|uniref:GPI transamidase component PIG-S-like n=1 Tax=Oppia nitens TaxID=1686743 RepID=UPI0023DA3B10|nr:GPI transamidase component PIG-S-like [Oppia nitens]
MANITAADDDNNVDNNTADNNRTDTDNNLGILSSVIYICIIVMVGFPLWWTTTSPSRHSLPDVSALMVSSQTIRHQLQVTVVAVDNDIDRQELKSQLVGNWPQKFSPDGSCSYGYEWKVRALLPKEELFFNNSGSQRRPLSDIDDKLTAIKDHETVGKLWLFVLPSNTKLISGQQRHVFGKNRFFYLRNDPKVFDEKSLAEIINELVESTQILTEKAYNSQRIDFLLYPEIDIIVNVVNEDETNNELLKKRVDEIHSIGDIGLTKQSGISELIRFNIITQTLHYVFKDNFISTHLNNANNNNDSRLTIGGTDRLFDVKNVPILMNTVESRVVEHNNKQSFHILVYIPSDGPLFFYDITHETKSNIMVTPFRGGVIVWNKDNDFVNGFRAVIRNLIALPNEIPKNLITNELFFAKWELDAIRRSITQKRILKTLASLESISKLIHKVNNIVIIQEIAKRMHTAVDVSIEAINCLHETDLKNAYKLSTKGYLSSETAFFDPSLLSLLYFPDDQKYAVYFPLFLPVSLPVFSSLYYLYKTYKTRMR